MNMTMQTSAYILNRLLNPAVLLPSSKAAIDVAIEKLNLSLMSKPLSHGTETVSSMVEWAIGRSMLVTSKLHGAIHWMSVFQNAVTNIRIGNYQREGEHAIDFTLVALLFSLFHDCRRVHEGPDDTHGAYGAAALSAFLRPMSPALLEFDIAIAACTLHTVVSQPRDEAFKNLMEIALTGSGLDHQTVSEQCVDVVKAVGMCLDADRMDLQRPGLMMEIDARYIFDYSVTSRSIAALRAQGVWSLRYIQDEFDALRK